MKSVRFDDGDSDDVLKKRRSSKMTATVQPMKDRRTDTKTSDLDSDLDLISKIDLENGTPCKVDLDNFDFSTLGKLPAQVSESDTNDLFRCKTTLEGKVNDQEEEGLKRSKSEMDKSFGGPLKTSETGGRHDIGSLEGVDFNSAAPTLGRSKTTFIHRQSSTSTLDVEPAFVKSKSDLFFCEPDTSGFVVDGEVAFWFIPICFITFPSFESCMASTDKGILAIVWQVSW